MKKILLIALCLSLISGTALAGHRPRHFGHYRPPHPAKIVHHHNWDPVAGLAIGIAGAAIGSIITSQNQNQYANITYLNMEPEKKCFILISQSTGKITKKCLSAPMENSEIIYIN